MALDEEQRSAIVDNRRAVARQVSAINTRDSRIRELVNMDERYASELATNLPVAKVLELLEAERAEMATAARELVRLSTVDLELGTTP